jgi:hypothetical protein
MSGWVKLHHKLLESMVFKSDGMLKIWIWCLLKASHKERWVLIKTGRGNTEVKLSPGQFIFGRKTAAKELGENENTTYKRIKKLKKSQNVTIESNTKYSIVTICNWETYQSEEKKSNIESNNQVTTKYQPSNTNKIVKIVKKDIYPSFFENFWFAYPKKIDKKTAWKVYKKKMKTISPEKIMSGLNLYKKYVESMGTEKQYIKNAATWLNGECWNNTYQVETTKTWRPQ